MEATYEKTQTPDIFEDLRLKLVTAHFGQGQKLRPDELREYYNCSANTVREVLFRMSTIGLVTFEEQRGFRVRDASRQDIHDLTKFRTMLEQQGAALSIAHGGIEWEAELAAAHHKLSHIEAQISRFGEIEPVLLPWCAAEWQFHEALIAACQSPLLHRTFRSIYDQFRQQLVTRERNYGYFSENVAEHQSIMEAALTRDVELCQQRIFEHLARNLSDEVHHIPAKILIAGARA